MDERGTLEQRSTGVVAIDHLYRRHYRPLVGLAARLLDERSEAEEVVQDAFLAFHDGRAHPRPGHEDAYLRSMVMNGARSRMRHRQVEDRHRPLRPPNAGPTDERALLGCERDRVGAALAALPTRQRQVVVLRYFVDLSEAQIADALGISTGSVKTHASRALRALAPLLAEAA